MMKCINGGLEHETIFVAWDSTSFILVIYHVLNTIILGRVVLSHWLKLTWFLVFRSLKLSLDISSVSFLCIGCIQLVVLEIQLSDPCEDVHGRIDTN